MKKSLFILIIFSLICVKVSAQHSFGIRGGAGTSSVSFKPIHENVMTDLMPTFGVSYLYRGGDKYVGGIEVDLNYYKAGYAYKQSASSDLIYKRSLNSIELPFFWHPYINMGKKQRASFFLNLGPYIGMTMGSSDITVHENGKLLETIDYDFNPIIDNVFNYGITGGAGLSLRFWKIDFITEFRYSYGLSDIVKNPNKYPISSYTESPMSRMNVTVGFLYNFINNKKNKK